MVTSKQHPRKASHSGSSNQHKARRRQPSPTQKRAKSLSAAVPSKQQQQDIRRPSAPPAIEAPRLSIADRFMASNYHSSPLPPSTNKSPSILSTSNSLTSHNTHLSVADKFMSSPAMSIQSIQQYRERSASSSSSSNKLQVKKDPEPGRLTIADAFMKSSSISSPTTRSRETSIADELDLGTTTRKPSQVHPLEQRQPSKSTFFEDSGALNLDLSLSLSSPTSSIHPRPWGSQETLVHLQDKKKPVYAQYIDSDLSKYESDKKTLADDHSAKLGKYEEYEEIDIDEYWEYDEYDDDEEEVAEKISYNESPSVTGSTAKLRHKEHEEKGEQQGFWVGCCFISCGTRQVKQKKKPDLEHQVHEQENKPRKFGFSRRGWVFCTFLSLIVFVLIAYFLWPRTPLMRIEGASLTSPAKITETKQGVMVGNVAFESEWLVNITVDNRQNHVPTRLVQVQVIAKDALTGLIIGKGVHNDDPNPEHIILAPNTISIIQIPIRVDYQARDSTDTTFVDLSKACAPHRYMSYNSPESYSNNGNLREALPLHFWITLHFFGLDWLGYKPTVIATPATGGFACPQS